MIFPQWYTGGFPDSELVVLDLLDPFLAMVPGHPEAVTWLPDDIEDHLPIVRVYRGGGGLDTEGLLDMAAVQVAVIGTSRADSWELLAYVREVLLTYGHGGAVLRADGSVTLVSSVAEMVGPQQIPELNPDHRMVQLTFQVVCPRPRSTPDYAAIRDRIVTDLIG